jgi:hypothetical protein
MVSFDSDHSGGVGASSFFFLKVSFLFFTSLFQNCWGCWKEFFLATLLIVGLWTCEVLGSLCLWASLGSGAACLGVFVWDV